MSISAASSARHGVVRGLQYEAARRRRRRRGPPRGGARPASIRRNGHDPTACIERPSPLPPRPFKDGLGTRVRVTDAGGDPVEHLELVPELANQESSIRDRVGRLINFRHARYVRLRSVDRAKTGLKPLVIAYDALDGHRLSTVLESLGKIPLTLDVDVALQIVRDLLPAIGILHDSRKVTHGCIAPERLVYTVAAAAGDRRSRPRRRAVAAEPPPQEAVGAVPHRLAGDQPRRLRREDGRRPDRPGRARPAARPTAHRRRVPGPGQAADLQHQGELVAHRLAADRPRAAPLARARHRRRRGADVQLDQGSAGRLRGRRRRRSLLADRGRGEGVLPPLRRAGREGAAGGRGDRRAGPVVEILRRRRLGAVRDADAGDDRAAASRRGGPATGRCGSRRDQRRRRPRPPRRKPSRTPRRRPTPRPNRRRRPSPRRIPGPPSSAGARATRSTPCRRCRTR